MQKLILNEENDESIKTWVCVSLALGFKFVLLELAVNLQLTLISR